MIAPESWRLPDALSRASDPVDGNPFPLGSSHHEVWQAATERAQEEAFRADAEALAGLSPDNAIDFLKAIVCPKFDVWAKRGFCVVLSDDDLHNFEKWLPRYANQWLDLVANVPADAPPEYPAMLTDLRNALASRVRHWQALAHGYRAKQEADAHAPFVPPDAVSKDRKKWRMDAVKAYRKKKGLKAEGLAQRIGQSTSTILDVVNEKRERGFSDAARDRLLQELGIALRDWYGP